MIEFIDLFAGIGGFHLGLERSHGFKCVWANEWDKYASSIYKKRFPETPCSTDDIRTISAESIPGHDLLCAGFPCQAFSVAGKRRGFEEVRGTLFYEIARIAEHKRPRLLLLENVKGLLSHDDGRTFATMLRILGSIGYKCEWQVLNSKWFGVPQNRERVFIIGHLGGEPSRTVFPITEIGGIPLEPSTETMGKGQRVRVANTLSARYGKDGSENLIKIGNIAESGHDSLWGRVYDSEGVATNLNAEGGGLGAKTGLYVVPVLTPDRLEKRQHGRRFKENGEESLTLTGQDVHGVMYNSSIRRLTPLECERLQGFPDGWTEGISDTQRYKCLGNAVTVNVIRFLGERISSLHEKAEVEKP